MATTKQQTKIIVPVMTEYATLVHPSIPSMSPTANTNQTIALLAFSDIESPPIFIVSTKIIYLCCSVNTTGD